MLELPELTPESFEILAVRELRKLGLEVAQLRIQRRATLPEPEQGHRLRHERLGHTRPLSCLAPRLLRPGRGPRPPRSTALRAPRKRAGGRAGASARYPARRRVTETGRAGPPEDAGVKGELTQLRRQQG